MDFSELVIRFPVVVATTLLSFVLTSVARYVAPHFGLMDKPDGKRKLHGQPIPVMGGSALFGTLVLVYAVSWLLATPSTTIAERQAESRLFYLLVSGGLFCLLGLCDDKWALRPRIKFMGQVLASLPFVLGGPPLEMIHVLGCTCELGAFAPVVTVLWLVACANIINLIDGLDGLAGCISLIAATTIGLLSSMYGNGGLALESLLLAGAIAGFLMHNWPPAKIFLGDSGSMTLGFLIGALSLQASLKTATVFTLSVPLVVLSVPIFDTAMAILRRKLTGRGIGDADRQHIHHRLQDRGLSKVQTLLAITGLCLTMAVSAIVATWWHC
jgi:UDP-GlcNAc:undecaprenyl-phosphate GlcNAc-1-phosphate transferase